MGATHVSSTFYTLHLIRGLGRRGGNSIPETIPVFLRPFFFRELWAACTWATWDIRHLRVLFRGKVSPRNYAYITTRPENNISLALMGQVFNSGVTWSGMLPSLNVTPPKFVYCCSRRRAGLWDFCFVKVTHCQLTCYVFCDSQWYRVTQQLPLCQQNNAQ